MFSGLRYNGSCTEQVYLVTLPRWAQHWAPLTVQCSLLAASVIWALQWRHSAPSAPSFFSWNWLGPPVEFHCPKCHLESQCWRQGTTTINKIKNRRTKNVHIYHFMLDFFFIKSLPAQRLGLAVRPWCVVAHRCVAISAISLTGVSSIVQMDHRYIFISLLHLNVEILPKF